MGVAGFTPFLQKICPAVLKQFPDRLRALEGKRVVIDGTLITQRFHFASNVHPHHHVLGWYRLANELKKNNVSAICVFDGKERSDAKKQELLRRKATRDLTATRGTIEDARFQRLHDLKGSVDQLYELDSQTRQEVIRILKDSEYAAGAGSAAGLVQEVIEKVSLDTEPLKTEQKVTEEVKERPELNIAVFPTAQSPNPAKLAGMLKSLYLSYKGDVEKLVSISTHPSPLLQPPDAPLEKQTEQLEERIVTKQQYQLTLQEGKLWNTLSASFDEPQFNVPASASADVVDILDKSFVMATSFEKRNNLPTSQTYADSKAILTAMGIPCIDAVGTVEAEALASSIVLEGHADYVVSEDTDVLVYEAPMIRNITSITEPLLIISGAEVRTELALSRDAYVDFVLLLGTDFSQRIKNLGPMRAYEFIKRHGCIESVLQAIKDQPRFTLKVSPEAYLAQVQVARLAFATRPAVPAEELMRQREPNDEAIKRILHKYELDRFVWNDLSYETALQGNVFHDNPFAA